MYTKIITGQFKDKIENPAMEYSFKIDDFQNHSFNCISKDENVLVTAHTGSGKTLIAEYAIMHYFKKGKKIIYTSPIKVLSNQKYKEFREKFEKYGMQIGLMTGDNKINPDADCVVMTTEILRNALYDIGETNKTKKDEYFKDNFIDNIGCVIFDEVHYINDKDRGHVWEETLILLNPSITLVMLSATIDKPERFAEWIGQNKKKIVNVIPTSHRVVPLEYYIYVNNDIHKIVDKKELFLDANFELAMKNYRFYNQIKKKKNMGLINESLEYLKNHDLLQAIYFCFSRKNCEKFAKSVNISLINTKEITEVNSIFNKYLHAHKEDLIKLEQYKSIQILIQKGIAYHHSGVLPLLKEIIEILFQRGLIKVLFATETFAVGVNMPTRTIIFTELEKPTDNGKRHLTTSEYKQMSGRAGRRGIDTLGNVIILPLYDFPYKDELKNIMFGKIPHIESKFQISYSFILKIIQSKSNNMKKFIDNSMLKSEDIEIANVIKSDIERFELELKLIDCEFNEQELIVVNKYEKLVNLERSGFVLNKKQYIEKQGMIKNKNSKKIVDRYDKINKIKNDIEHSRNNMNGLIDDMNICISKYVEFLRYFGYINNVNDKQNFWELVNNDISVKGIIASQINECNPLILTEMIFSDIFDDMEIIEIISLLAIFVDEIKSDEEVSIECDIKKYMNIVDDIIDRFIDKEDELSITNYYDVNYNCVDMAYDWANGCNFIDIKTKYDIYEGNFIKIILKLNNIAQDTMKLCQIYGNIKVLPKFEKIQDLLIRDIVSIKSLYL